MNEHPPSMPEPRAEAGAGTAPPILILSCYRTGSTLLRLVVDTHREIYCPPEVALGQTAYQLAYFGTPLRRQSGDPADPGPIPPAVLSLIRETLGRELCAAAARKGKRIWCEKTPGNLSPENLAVLNQAFPDARCLCLHRHALDVIQSLVKLIHRLPELQPFLLKNGVVAAALNYWNERTARLLQHEQDHPSRCFRLRYEDMVANPAKVFEPMFRFLGVEWDESVIAGVFEAEHDRGQDDTYVAFTRTIHAGSVGAGRNVSLVGVPESTVAAMRALLRRLDYPEAPVAGSAASAGSNAIPAGGLRWFFETHLPARMRAEPSLCALFTTSYQFVITGSDGGTWVLDPRQGQGSASCTVEVSAADLFAIAHGELHPWKAAEQRRLRLRGDVQARELEKLVRLLHLPKTGSGGV